MPGKKAHPNYAKIKVPNTSQAATKTQNKTQIIHIKEEIKFLYRKKDKLNRDLHQAKLKAAQEWNSLWPPIQESIETSINSIVNRKYTNLHDKLHRLEEKQHSPHNKTVTVSTIE